MRFSDRLRQAGAAIWESQHAHPFVRGLTDGSLDLERFKVWVRQDYLFLIDYARVLAYAAARAPDVETMGKFAELCHATLNVEMGLHRAYAEEFGITAAELERETRAPTTQAYTDFLMRAAAAGSFPEMAAALLPCMWGYADIGARLVQGPRPHDPRYARWIDMYASPEFQALAGWCRGLVDRLGQEAPAAERRRMEEAFITSLRYEYLFWDMAYGRETWKV